MTLWQGEPLVLASKSAPRRALLEAAGIPLVIDPADIDEREAEAASPKEAATPEGAALLLARAKALETAKRNPGRIVLGADQTLALGSERFSKPRSIDAARAQLKQFSSKTHALHSGIALLRDSNVLFETVSSAHLTMHALSDAFLDAYLADAGDRVMQSVGAYQLESVGVNLFEKIEGDHFTILGMPLMPLLAYCRKAGMIVS
ncbi:MAG: Maf family protein [Xanthobacteraceae bacterium]|nr:Maf family protein [Xanthobacteraceae bacterium]